MKMPSSKAIYSKPVLTNLSAAKTAAAKQNVRMMEGVVSMGNSMGQSKGPVS